MPMTARSLSSLRVNRGALGRSSRTARALLVLFSVGMMVLVRAGPLSVDSVDHLLDKAFK